VVSLQNGIGNAETIARYAPGRTICAVTSMGADIENSCTTRWTGRGPTILAPFENTPMHCATTVAENLQHCGIDASATTDADELLWSKLIINCAINPVTAAYRITNGELLNHNEAYRTACAIARECAQVARAANIKLSYSDPIEAFTSVCRKTSGNRSSMLRDILNGNRTEIDSINGSVIKRAEQLGLPTPENRRIFDLITHPQRLET
jgi:2-dehydropantoate 2-reductase